jgi:phospholipid/cholesterol/gamma-HCH transport system ATP-binding protein
LKSEEEINQIVRDKLAVVGLEGQEDRYPAELSGGMKKRVAIARALVIEPQLILYDEPTSELDPLRAVVIAEEIFRLNRRIHVTSIVVSHERELAFGIADRIAIMNDGEVLMVGAPAEIRASSHPMIREFLAADFKLNTERTQL